MLSGLRFVSCFVAVCAVIAIVMTPERTEARCYTFQESHNGTDLFNWDDGAKTAARIKLMESIELWKQKRGKKRVRFGKITYRCDPWTLTYILPHHRCYARARVCG